MVHVRYGVNGGDFDVAGRTVAFVRSSLRQIYAIDDAALAYVNGQRVGESDTLDDGGTLEFIKASGSKNS